MKTKILITILFTLVLSACEQPQIIPNKYHRGDFVVSALSGEKGQILSVWEYSDGYRYKVRFSSGDLYTDTHLLSSDGPIHRKQFEIEYMYEFELGAYEESK